MSVQQVELTQEEKLKMYMKCTKLELAKMLVERDRLEALKSYPFYIPTPNYQYDCGCPLNSVCHNTACPRRTIVTYSTDSQELDIKQP